MKWLQAGTTVQIAEEKIMQDSLKNRIHRRDLDDIVDDIHRWNKIVHHKGYIEAWIDATTLIQTSIDLHIPMEDTLVKFQDLLEKTASKELLSQATI